ncbi:thioredoxin-like protein [Irpex lacteus]|nr:thioredoxin-like protein [Irpex lacteus]
MVVRLTSSLQVWYRSNSTRLSTHLDPHRHGVKVYGHPQSTFTQLVLVVLKEKDVPYELVTIDWAIKEHKTSAYLENHPFGQFPYIDDDGFVLYESIAIAKYIAHKYRHQGTPLNFNPFTTPIVIEKFGKVIRGVQPDEQAVKGYVAALKDKLEGYEIILAKHRYLAGDTITVADLAHLPTGTILSLVGIKLLEDSESRPNVASYHEVVERNIYRSTWKEVVTPPIYRHIHESLCVTLLGT